MSSLLSMPGRPGSFLSNLVTPATIPRAGAVSRLGPAVSDLRCRASAVRGLLGRFGVDVLVVRRAVGQCCIVPALAFEQGMVLGRVGASRSELCCRHRLDPILVEELRDAAPDTIRPVALAAHPA